MTARQWLWFLACCAPSIAFAQNPPGLTTGHPDGMSELAPIVFVCVNQKGELMSAHIDKGSGFAEIDEAALKVARATKFSPGTNKQGKPQRRSCLKLKVKFVIKDGEVVPDAGPENPAAPGA